MGADQSTPRQGGQPSTTTAEPKTCYYDLLGVTQQATDEEIRRAYKKKALELHPDRNLRDVDTATKRFAEVQTAYEILSDSQERAWYDSHRDAILQGIDPDAPNLGGPGASPNRYTTSASIFDLMGRFRSSVPMNDSQGGFFGALNLFFDQLAMEEADACERDGLTPVDYPPFGRAADSYERVTKSFYQVWAGFSTKKSFSWKDKYRLSDAPDRRIRRLMEKENKKFRDEGIREFNDAVQSLVAFVKKRDPRYVPNTQSEAERQDTLRHSAAAQAARSRAANREKLADFVVPEWAQSRGDEYHSGEFSFSEEESEVECIECVICDKVFKSEQQFGAHERSKKHIKAVQQLRRQMKKEDADIILDTDQLPSSSKMSLRTTQASTSQTTTNVSNSEDLLDELATSTKQEDDTVASSVGEPDLGVDQEDLDGVKSNGDDDDYAPRSVVEDRLGSGATPDSTTLPGAGKPGASPLSLGDAMHGLSLDAPGRKKIGKAKLKREKKAARQAQEQDAHICGICHEAFPSRSKLFFHIKDLDHAVLVTSVTRPGKQGVMR